MPAATKRLDHRIKFTAENIRSVPSEFIQAHEGLIRTFVKVVVNHYDAKNFEADLLQEGRFAVFIAYQTYDETKLNPQNGKPYRFSTYAGKRIYWHLTRYLALMQAPVNYKNKASKTGGQNDLLHLLHNHTSLNETLPNRNRDGDDLSEAQDYLTDDSLDQCAQLINQNCSAFVRTILYQMNLDRRERDILELRLMSDPPAILEKIAQLHGLSKERVRQIELKLLNRLKKRFAPFREALI